MSPPAPYAERLADEITHRLALLADQLTQLPPAQAAPVIARTLDPEPADGVLGGITHLMAVSSMFAKAQVERGTLGPEVWLALGRAANALDDVALDLDEHCDALRHVGTQPAGIPGKPPAPAAFVVRRRR